MTRERRDLPKVISQQLDEVMKGTTPKTTRSSKHWWQSKTIRLHAVNAAQALIVLAVEFLSTHPNATLTRAELVNLAVSALTIVLRVFTDQPITEGPKA